MTRSTQAKIAILARIMVVGSTILPLAAVVMLFTLRELSVISLTLTCASIVGSALIALRCLSLIEKDMVRRKVLTWFVVSLYFLYVLAVVAVAFESVLAAVIIGLPEALGLLLSISGMFHAVSLRNRPVERGSGGLREVS